MNLILDDCVHCACSTELSGYTVEAAIKALFDGDLGCENCMDEQEENPDGHTACVDLYCDGVVVWDGRCRKDDVD